MKLKNMISTESEKNCENIEIYPTVFPNSANKANFCLRDLTETLSTVERKTKQRKWQYWKMVQEIKKWYFDI